MALNSIISSVYDLKKDLTMQRLNHELAMDDNLGDLFVVSIKDGGQPADLSGAAVQAYFIRADGYTVPMTGSVNGSAVEVLLTDACYLKPGRCTMTIKVSKGDVRHAVYCAEGVVRRTMTDSLIDPGGTIPSLDELLAQIATIEDAVARANEAADAAQEFVGLTVTANTLPTGQAATANFANGVLTLGLPRGEKGETGSASAMKVNGIEGVGDNITITGTNIPVSARNDTPLATAVEKARSFDNVLVNSNFMAPINQRGLTTYTGQGYTIDRWKGVADDAEVTVTGNGITASGRMRQSVQAGEYADLGTKITAAVGMADGTTKCISGDLTGITADWVTVWLENDQVHYELASGTYKWAALYKGEYTLDTLPPYVSKGVAHETLECQRYYQRMPISRQPIYCSSATEGATSIMLPIPMWRTPTMTVVKTGTIRCNGVSAITVREVRLEALQGNVLWLNTTHNSTANTSGYTGTWNGGEITLEAEL